MIKKLLLLSSISILSLQSTYAFAAKSSLTTAGDVTQVLVPLTAIGIATYKGDTEGQKEFLKSFAVNTAMIFALKYSLRNTEWGTRPNGGKHSFPSGHAAAAFQGAFFLQNRYGIEYGAPAMAVAGFTGYTRVKGKYHHWRDVIGGTALAFGVNHFLVSRYEDEKVVQVSTNVGRNTAMLGMQVNF